MTTKRELHYLKARLLFLEKMGLAETCGSNQWHVRADLRAILTALAQANDRQRALAAHRSILSDARLPLSLTDVRKLQRPLEGRVIGHGEEEASGRTYMIGGH